MDNSSNDFNFNPTNQPLLDSPLPDPTDFLENLYLEQGYIHHSEAASSTAEQNKKTNPSNAIKSTNQAHVDPQLPDPTDFVDKFCLEHGYIHHNKVGSSTAEQNEMTNPSNTINSTNQAHVDPQLPDPTDFVDKFCLEHGYIHHNKVGSSTAEQNEMTNPSNAINSTNQAHVDPQLPDPTDFVEKFCLEHGYIHHSKVGSSKVEQCCMMFADVARQRYETFVDTEFRLRRGYSPDMSPNQASGAASSSRTPVSLSPEQRLSRTQFTKKKSAAAKKVYNEVLKRAQVTFIRASPQVRSQESGEEALKCQTLLESNSQLRKQIAKDNEKVSVLKNFISLLKDSAEHLEVNNRGLEMAVIEWQRIFGTPAGSSDISEWNFTDNSYKDEFQ